ncbi:hypothetical protein C8R44DRAFT_800843 [Mycena epipterygia]|nr:hypothetical protein C8R44DRAFT_800843 [Mycena epipterygia]
MEFSGISQAGTETPTTFASLPNLPSEDPEAAVARRRELLQARRAERLARETAGPPQNRYIPPRSPTRVEASGSTVMSELERRMPLATGGAARDHRTPETSRGGFRGRGGTNMRGSKGGGRGARGGAGRGGKRGQRRDREDEDGEEFGDAEIEEWLESDDIEHASALQPEIRAGDLDRVFRSGDQLRGTLKPRAMREIIGGDYSRFTPLNSQHFISAARKLGPARYSSVVLAHSKDLPAGNRSHVQKIVGSVAGSSSKTRRKL